MTLSMKTIEYGRWRISCDAHSTAQAYAAVSIGGAEECGCDPCLNFAAQKCDLYPPEVLALFGELGIDRDREVEVYHMARMGSGRHLYGGWFHFVGSIVSGADAAKQIAENLWQPDLLKASENFILGFTSIVHLRRKSFENLPLTQLEFTTEIPWVTQQIKEPQ